MSKLSDLLRSVSTGAAIEINGERRRWNMAEVLMLQEAAKVADVWERRLDELTARVENIQEAVEQYVPCHWCDNTGQRNGKTCDACGGKVVKYVLLPTPAPSAPSDADVIADLDYGGRTPPSAPSGMSDDELAADRESQIPPSAPSGEVVQAPGEVGTHREGERYAFTPPATARECSHGVPMDRYCFDCREGEPPSTARECGTHGSGCGYNEKTCTPATAREDLCPHGRVSGTPCDECDEWASQHFDHDCLRVGCDDAPAKAESGKDERREGKCPHGKLVFVDGTPSCEKCAPQVAPAQAESGKDERRWTLHRRHTPGTSGWNPPGVAWFLCEGGDCGPEYIHVEVVPLAALEAERQKREAAVKDLAEARGHGIAWMDRAVIAENKLAACDGNSKQCEDFPEFCKTPESEALDVALRAFSELNERFQKAEAERDEARATVERVRAARDSWVVRDGCEVVYLSRIDEALASEPKGK